MEKKLYRVNEGKMISGVCGGIAEYFNTDPTLIRLVYIACSFFLGAIILGVIAYAIAAIVIPIKPEDAA